MAESQTVTILRAKRDAIGTAIINYERQLEQAKADFAHITAALAIFDAGDKPGSQRPYICPCTDSIRLATCMRFSLRAETTCVSVIGAGSQNP